MNPAQLKERIRKVGQTQSSIAKSAGCTKGMVWAVIHRRARTPWVRRVIADAVGAPFKEVWGVEDPKVDRLPGGPRSRITSP